MTLDLEGYRQGSLNALLKHEVVVSQRSPWTNETFSNSSKKYSGRPFRRRGPGTNAASAIRRPGFRQDRSSPQLAQGFAEVVYAQREDSAASCAIVAGCCVRQSANNILITRASARIFRAVRRLTRNARYFIRFRSDRHPSQPDGQRERARFSVIAAGTSDIPVAEEAAITAEIMGNRWRPSTTSVLPACIGCCNTAGQLAAARVIICVAGMEGALPSVVAGLVHAPVIAVPTSVGYGASFGGLAALLGMLNSCASNTSVVNIDNGFGGGYVASVINRL